MGYIYSITNKINGKTYVGQSDNVKNRFNAHIFKLEKQYHENSLLQEDFNKYGEDAFEFKTILQCDDSELDDLERFYIKRLNAFEDDGGYNVTTGGKNSFEFSKGYLERLSKSNKGNKKLCESNKASWTKERREAKSKEMTELYKDPEERKKTAEATKAGMAKLPPEKLSRRHLNPYPIETLLEVAKRVLDPNDKITQKNIVEEYGIAIATAKSLRSKKHWIYDEIKQGKYRL